jgi:hypothetical protein
VRLELAALGYERIMHKYYWNPLYLDLYALPGARPGKDVPVNGSFEGEGAQAIGWDLPPDSSLQPAEPGGRELILRNAAPAESRAVTEFQAKAETLYILDVEVQSQLRAGRVRVFFICRSSTGHFLTVMPDDAGASPSNDGDWHSIRIAALCPAGTTSALIDLRNAGSGEVVFRDVEVQEVIARRGGE